MTTFILLNDVDVGLSDLLIGSNDTLPSNEGEHQANVIANFLHTKVQRITRLVSSPLPRVNNLVHKIRVSSPDHYLMHLDLNKLPAFRERDFGVLDGTHLPKTSDIFTYSRILPEGGESLAQFRDRVIPALRVESQKNKVTLIVTHPYVCQLCANALLGRSLTALNPFWIDQKGSFMVLDIRGLLGTLRGAYNALDSREYSLSDIYE